MTEVGVRTRAVALGALAALALTGCSWQPAAAEVNGSRIEMDDLRQDASLMARNPGLHEQFFGPGVAVSESRASSDVTSGLLTREILFRLLRAEGARSGFEVTAEDRLGLGDQVEQFLAQGQIDRSAGVDSFMGKAVDLVVLRTKFCTAAASADAEACDNQIGRLLSGADIKVNPRFGSWQADQLTIVPPTAAIPGTK